MFGFEEFVEALRASPIQLDWGAGWASGDDTIELISPTTQSCETRGVDQFHPKPSGRYMIVC